MITINGHLDGLNEYTKANRASPYAGASMKKKNEAVIMAAIDDALDACEVQAVTDETAYPLRLHIIWHDDTRRDYDNVVFAKKFILDAMTKRGIIEDDDRKHIKSIYEEVITDKENPRIEVYFDR